MTLLLCLRADLDASVYVASSDELRSRSCGRGKSGLGVETSSVPGVFSSAVLGDDAAESNARSDADIARQLVTA